MVYPTLLPLMRTPRLPVVDWTHVPRRFKRSRPFRRKTKSGFCSCLHISTGLNPEREREKKLTAQQWELCRTPRQTKQFEHFFVKCTPSFEKPSLFVRILRLRPLVLLIWLKWRWVWNIDGIILTQQNRRKNLSQFHSDHHKLHRNCSGIEPGPPRIKAGY